MTENFAVGALQNAMAYIRRNGHPNMPIQQLAILLLVYESRTCTVRDLLETLGLSQASASRNIASLAKARRSEDGADVPPLLNLSADRCDHRRKTISLTDHGRQFMQDLILMNMGRGESSRPENRPVATV